MARRSGRCGRSVVRVVRSRDPLGLRVTRRRVPLQGLSVWCRGPASVRAASSCPTHEHVRGCAAVKLRLNDARSSRRDREGRPNRSICLPTRGLRWSPACRRAIRSGCTGPARIIQRSAFEAASEIPTAPAEQRSPSLPTRSSESGRRRLQRSSGILRPSPAMSNWPGLTLSERCGQRSVREEVTNQIFGLEAALSEREPV